MSKLQIASLLSLEGLRNSGEEKRSARCEVAKNKDGSSKTVKSTNLTKNDASITIKEEVGKEGKVEVDISSKAQTTKATVTVDPRSGKISANMAVTKPTLELLTSEQGISEEDFVRDEKGMVRAKECKKPDSRPQALQSADGPESRSWESFFQAVAYVKALPRLPRNLTKLKIDRRL